MQKSLLTQNAPAELRGGIVSFDRLVQQVSKTTSTSIVGLMLVSADLSTIFWMIGILSLLERRANGAAIAEIKSKNRRAPAAP
jgi:hypothetical protein